ncbi:MAG: ATP-binding cassette domain-containing protein [Spirochaetia bacterium]|jgi:oligopeptide transport system ATP-binding protein|nr:ATP-binding cassette domain-containing protein [Spirochaetia bacterium]
MDSSSSIIMEVNDLVCHFSIKGQGFLGKRKKLRAVDGISFDVARGKTFGIVGESGCGKSTTAKLVLNMIPPTSGEVVFNGLDMTSLRPSKWRRLRAEMQMMFQDPLGALDPYMTIGKQIKEPLDIHRTGDSNKRKEKVLELLESVGMENYMYDRYPHEISGGQRQRAVLARALILEPQLLVCDEPISALDVSIQAQVVNLLKNIQKERGITYIFISHDLRIVKHICDRVAVMYLGKIVEEADRRELFNNTAHPYTRALISSIPIPDPSLKRETIILPGDPPSPVNLPSGCRFASRCPIVIDKCRESEPPLEDIGNNHKAACYRIGVK